MAALTALNAGVRRLCGAAWPLRLTLLMGLALAMMLPGLAQLPVMDRDEARFVQASRQMVQSGDLIDIRFQDEARHKKPVGIYWLQSLSAVTFGQGAEAPLWVWRLPSLLGAVAAVLLVAGLGTPWVGAGPATMAALAFAACFVLQGEARIAKTDAVLLATILAAQLALARVYAAKVGMEGTPKRWVVWLFWSALGLSVLIKGPIGPMVVGLTVLALCLWHRQAGWLRPLAHGPAIAVGLAIVLPWLIAITVKSGGAFWQASVGADLMAKAAAGQEGKGAPPGTYLLALWVTFWPVSVLLAASLPAIWRNRRSAASVFLLCWLVPTWLVFEAVPTKLIHYTLPVYPALALLVVPAFLAGAGGVAGLSLLAAAVALMIGALPALVLLWLGEPMASVLPVAAGLGIGGVAGGVALMSMRRGPRHAAVLSLVACAACVHGGLVMGLARQPVLWPTEAAMAAATTAAARQGCAKPAIIGWGYTEPSLVWRAGRDTVLLPAAAALDIGLTRNLCTVVIRNTSTPPPPAGLRKVAQVSGFALGAGRWVDLDILIAGGTP